MCEVSWKYQPYLTDQAALSAQPSSPDFIGLYHAIRNNLLQTFSSHKSLSVQHTLYAMGESILKEFAEIEEITLKMPNKHHIPFNLEPFGMDNHNEIFIATDEPYGYITGTLIRE